ncbi:F-box/kelch-repeat protein At3g23880-like [Lotus japonicus]|uniref:F-box/kelch-repeat protein At3g23880-like n=1 Tax=Lotus japonicus TaxID=34305 RepID=UPI002588EA21|nr:F-box/kelch-repeat protein At3g23880-like [Lotus japonicus]
MHYSTLQPNSCYASNNHSKSKVICQPKPSSFICCYSPMAPDRAGDDKNGVVSSLLRTLQRSTTSTETLTPPSLPPAGDSLHAPPLPSLPFDLVVEILCRLPVKPLLQFRCVCKSWKSLISDPKFAKKHLHSSPSDFIRHRLIVNHHSDDSGFRAYPLLSVFNTVPAAATATQLEYPLIIQKFNYVIVGSCNGVLCFFIDRSFALLWNPSTRRFKKSPSLENPRLKDSFTKYGFGYDHFADSYKVVAVFCYEDGDSGLYKTQANIHTLGTHCWRRIQELPCVPVQSAIFVSGTGTLNWLASDDNRSESVNNWMESRAIIISQDLRKECYQKLLLPDDYGHDDGGKGPLNLQVLRDCLCLCVHSFDSGSCDIWFMKEYGSKESWTKLFIVPNPDGCFSFTKPFHISKEDEVLVIKLEIIYLYNSRDNTFKIYPIQNIEDWMIPVVYVESLISPCF